MQLIKATDLVQQSRITDIDKYFLDVALQVARRSPHPNIKVGAIYLDPRNQNILFTAVNQPAVGIDINSDWARDCTKSDLYSCAEKNGTAHAAKSGIALEGKHLYLAAICIDEKGNETETGITPCSSCADVTIVSGISRIITFDVSPNGIKPKWLRPIEIGRLKLMSLSLPITYKKAEL